MWTYDAWNQELKILESYIIPTHLTMAVCHDFLSTVLPELLSRCGAADWESFMVHTCWWSTHFLLAVREFLNNLFLKQWIARGEPTERPTRSPDLNP